MRFGSDVYRFIFAAKTMSAQTDRSFREAIMTFRRMSLKESQQVKAAALKAVTVGKTTRWRAWRTAWRSTTAWSASGCSTASDPKTASSRARSSSSSSDQVSPALGVERELARHTGPKGRTNPPALWSAAGQRSSFGM